MKIISFAPLIVTKDAENVIKLFEELGFGDYSIITNRSKIGGTK